ncbi:hypothetical protein SY88_22765 [Clostridiales bacterium PH28_bin88]|nr:hypothetical protein SY88_22765 [Clostridiales bacterium PH28_bin88]
MKVLALTWALWRDFFRGKAVVFQLVVVVLFISYFLNPRLGTYEWQYVALYLGWATLFLAALSSGLLIWRNADNKLDILVLKAGKTSFYFAVFLAALLIAVFWLALISAYIALLIPIPDQVLPEKIQQLSMAIISNLLVITALFLFFSPLTGRAIEPYLAVIVILISFGIGDQGQPWQQLAVFFPPIVENIKAGVNATGVQMVRSLTYLLVALSLGLVRFIRREFIWP